MISPLIFIEVLEKVHLIHRLDALIIEQACKDLRDDIDSGFAYQPISVNLSRLDFELSDIKKIVDDAVAKYNVPKEYLVLEVTESAFSSDLSNLGDVIHSFRKDGYQVWIDDFGSGYSSFNNLQTYDFDFLKIDMNFMRNFDKNPKSKVIIASIVDMAKRLGIHTLAEGVETKEQYEFLRNIGCELIQGYYFAKPTPLEEFQKNRSDLCSFETNESPEERVYYDNIGKVNFLDSTPLRDNPLDVASFVPIAILEQSGRTYTDIYINEPYMKVIESFGAKNFADALKFARTGNSRDHLNKVYEQLKYSEKTGKPITFNLILNGKKINCRARFIGRFGEKAAYTFISRNISYYEEM